jgi:phage baseplate assembly protein W
MPSEIAIPFRVDGNGRVVTTDNPDAQVRLHVLALLGTIPEERAMVPGFGTGIISNVFGDPDGDAVAQQTAVMVRDAFRTWEPGVDLVRAEANTTDSEGNLASVDVEYRRLDAADSGTVANSNSAIIGANGIVREIVRG